MKRLGRKNKEDNGELTKKEEASGWRFQSKKAVGVSLLT
jgi:hypothetical protein